MGGGSDIFAPGPLPDLRPPPMPVASAPAAAAGPDPLVDDARPADDADEDVGRIWDMKPPSIEFINETERDSAETQAAQVKSQILPHDRGLKGSSSHVPNPLALLHDNASSMLSVCLLGNRNQSHEVSKETKTCVSTSPAPPLPGSNSPARSSSAVPLGGQLADIAISMSSQHYQNDGLKASTIDEVVPQVRGRIFSVDLDPAVLDFSENSVEPLLSDQVDVCDVDSTDIHNNISGSRSTFFSSRDSSDHTLGCLSMRRDRGFSFDFFSLDLIGDEPLPSAPALAGVPNLLQGNRMIGDSTMVNPTNGRVGSLMSPKQDIDHLDGDQSAVSRTASHALSLHPSVPPTVSAPVWSVNSSQDPVSCVHPTHPKSHVKGKSTPLTITESPGSGLWVPAEATVTLSCDVPLSDNTVSTSHGSVAAAAAGPGLPQSLPSAPTGFFSFSQTSCPTEHLNKGGRIGIYLPEERKARIARFHSKRKIRIWRKRIKYDCRKKLADSRPRVKGRFVKRSDVDGEVPM